MIDGLSPSMEHYIQTIFLLQKKHKVARVKEIADFMNVTMPSVTSAVKSLRDKKLVENTRYGYVELTTEGKAIATDLIERHKLLRQFLIDILKLDESVADIDACRIEHVISDEAMDRLNEFIKFIHQTSALEKNWTQSAMTVESKVPQRGGLLNKVNT